MITLAPSIHPGRSAEEREAFLRKAGILGVTTVSMGYPPIAHWDDADVVDTKQFLDSQGVRVGEFSHFHSGLGSADAGQNRAALDHYRGHLRHAGTLGARCVGFSLGLSYRCTPDMWSESAWRACLAATEELVRAAEEAEVDVAVHPHIMTPLHSVERHKELFASIASPRLKSLMDPVNLTWPQMFYRTGELLEQIFDELGDKIVALHAKDLTMSGVDRHGSELAYLSNGGLVYGEHLSVVHLDEAVPGARQMAQSTSNETGVPVHDSGDELSFVSDGRKLAFDSGGMDFPTLLGRLAALEHEVTVHAEHFSYANTVLSYQYFRHVAREIGVAVS